MTSVKDCDICLEEFSTVTERLPRVLQRGHTFCNSCINQLRDNSLFICSICRKKNHLYQHSCSNVLFVINRDLISAINIPIEDHIFKPVDTKLFEEQYAKSKVYHPPGYIYQPQNILIDDNRGNELTNWDLGDERYRSNIECHDYLANCYSDLTLY